MRTVKLGKSLNERTQVTKDISNCAIIKDILDNNNNNNNNNKSQLALINRLYLDEEFPERAIVLREIKAKISGYRQQDIEKTIYNESSLITLEQTIEKLVASALKCIYCNKHVYIVYKNQREPLQWTLDRKNNNLDHSNENTVISCLKCNLERRRRNMKDFQFSKQLTIVRSYD